MPFPALLMFYLSMLVDMVAIIYSYFSQIQSNRLCFNLVVILTIPFHFKLLGGGP
jgi:hypothetical protein